MQPNAFFEISQFAFSSAKLQMMLLISNSDTSRIVSAIFEFPKPVDDQRHDLFISYVTDNSTHNNELLNRPGAL